MEKKDITHQVDAVVSNFHSHLDECLQCRENPFNLCPIGSELLVNCANKPMPEKFNKLINEHFWDFI